MSSGHHLPGIHYLHSNRHQQPSSSLSLSSSSSSSSAVLRLLSSPSKDNKPKENKAKARKNGKKGAFGSKFLSSPSKIRQRGRGGAGLKFGGKKPHQVARRNERERKRVEGINNGFETLASKLSVSCSAYFDKKLTKAQTLKAAIFYIRHLEGTLSSEKAMDGSSIKGTAEEDFHRQCLAIAAEKGEETTDDQGEDGIKEMEEDGGDVQHNHHNDRPPEAGIHHCLSFSSSDHLSSISSSDHLSSFSSSDHLSSISSSDHLSSFSSSDHLSSFSSSDYLPSISSASSSSFSPSYCYPPPPYPHHHHPLSFHSLPSPVFSYSSSAPLQSLQSYRTTHYFSKNEQV
uniref:BHLH domain-containing protein n=1 Tax=Globodera rostochiensis TaxID=31243 RepID=A0A914H3Y2_GLORO